MANSNNSNIEIRRGFEVLTRDAKLFGRVSDLVLDEDSDQLTHIVVSTAEGEDSLLLPSELIDRTEPGSVILTSTWEWLDRQRDDLRFDESDFQPVYDDTRSQVVRDTDLHEDRTVQFQPVEQPVEETAGRGESSIEGSGVTVRPNDDEAVGTGRASAEEGEQAIRQPVPAEKAVTEAPEREISNPLNPPDARGTTEIRPRVVSQIAGLALQHVVGVYNQDPSSNAESNPGKGVSADVGRTEAAVDLHILVDYDQHIPTVCEQVRNAVRSDVERLVGTRVTEVNIRVDDVLLGERFQGQTLR